MADPNFMRQLKGYSLTTAEILYRMPDHQNLLQSYIWQEFDEFPNFPRLSKFLQFWTEKLDGPLYHVKIAHRKLIEPAELRMVDGAFQLN